MASTRIRLSTRNRSDITNIFDIPVWSTAPMNNEIIAYNATTGYLETAPPASTLPFIMGNKIFEDGIRIGVDGTVINTIRFARFTFPTPINIDAGNFHDEALGVPITAGDLIFATAFSNVRGLNCTHVVDTTVTPNVDYIRVQNRNTASVSLIELLIIIFNV